MTITFHDGTNKLYKKYAPFPWDNIGLLQMNPKANTWDDWLVKNYNTEKKIRELFEGDSVSLCMPYGTGSKLGEYVGAKETGIIILKGLHQWQRIRRTENYKLHLTFGLDGWLWHLNARYCAQSDSISLTGDCTKGEQATGEDHEGFTFQKKKKR